MNIAIVFLSVILVTCCLGSNNTEGDNEIMNDSNSVDEHYINPHEYDNKTKYGIHHGYSFRNMYEGLGADEYRLRYSLKEMLE